MNAHGTVNHLSALARRLPPPMSVGMWMRIDGVRFQVAAGHDEHGRPALAWQVDDAALCFRPVLAA